MHLNVTKVPEVVGQWLDTTVIPKSNTLQKFSIYVAFGLRSPELVEQAKAFADKDGNIDLDKLEPVVTDALNKVGGHVPLMGWDFDNADLAKILEYAKQRGN